MTMNDFLEQEYYLSNNNISNRNFNNNINNSLVVNDSKNVIEKRNDYSNIILPLLSTNSNSMIPHEEENIPFPFLVHDDHCIIPSIHTIQHDNNKNPSVIHSNNIISRNNRNNSNNNINNNIQLKNIESPVLFVSDSLQNNIHNMPNNINNNNNNNFSIDKFISCPFDSNSKWSIL
jgi:hypothetical protein